MLSVKRERLSLPSSDPFQFLEGEAHEVAPRLLGCFLEREIDGHKLVGRIVETEAYDQGDAASHSYKGETQRTKVMFGPAGHLYVYFTYGMHYCMNIVTGVEGRGSAVLIRALEPVGGENIMNEFRHRGGFELTNGPAKLCQALNIDIQMNGHDLNDAPLRLHVQPPLAPSQIKASERIGISKAVDVPWRFFINDNPYVSR